MDLMLEGKAAIVTGSTGICKAAALALAKEGCRLAVTYFSEADRLASEDTARQIEKLGRSCIRVPLNVLDLGSIRTMVADVLSAYGRIDVLVNCAGVCTSVLAENASEAQWDLDMGVDLKGLFFCCREVFVQAMKRQQGGAIVNVASVVGVNPVKTNPIYSTAKAGVIQISRYLGIEWGPYNVRVNAISPGWVATEMLLEFQKSGKSADPQSVTRSVPLGRFGKPEEIADAITFLASEKSSFTTGSNLVCDGGMIAGIRLSSLVQGKIEML